MVHDVDADDHKRDDLTNNGEKLAVNGEKPLIDGEVVCTKTTRCRTDDPSTSTEHARFDCKLVR